MLDFWIRKLPGGLSMTVSKPVLRVLPPVALLLPAIPLWFAPADDVEGMGECATGGSDDKS